MSVFESSIDFAFVNAVKSIAKELNELNMTLRENRKAAEVPAIDEREAYLKVKREYLLADAKEAAERAFDETYLSEYVSQEDYEKIVELFERKHDSELPDSTQWEAAVLTVFAQEHFAPWHFEKPIAFCLCSPDGEMLSLKECNEFFWPIKGQ